MGSIDGYASAIFCPEEAECQIGAIDSILHEDIAGGIIFEFEIRFRNIDSRVHPVGFIVLNRIGVIFPFAHFESAIDGRTEYGRGDLADTASEFRFRTIILYDQFGKISVFPIDLAKVFYEREFFSWGDHHILELFQGPVDVENTIFGRTAEIRRSSTDKFLETETLLVAAHYFRFDRFRGKSHFNRLFGRSVQYLYEESDALCLIQVSSQFFFLRDSDLILAIGPEYRIYRFLIHFA